MSRTPLFSRLLDVASVAAEAAGRDASVDRVLDERAERAARAARRVTRRDFLALAAVAGGLAACDRAERVTGVVTPRPGAAKARPTTRVAIVGAGLAGLTCAHRLRQAGIEATVYEANTRLGGRCWTRRGDFADAQIAEHGGELIDQSHTEIRQLAQELGLQLDNVLRAEPPGAEPFFHVFGGRYSFAEATRDMKAVWQPLHRDLSESSFPTQYDSYTPRGRQLDQMSIAQWIDSRVPGGRQSRLGRLLEVAYVIEYGAEAEEQSALNLIYLMGYSGQGQLRLFGPSNEKYHVRGGNDLIVKRLEAALDTARIARGMALTAIARTPAGAYALTLEGPTGTTVATADHVVLTVPFSVMRTAVDYSAAGFSDVKQAAIAGLGMGMNAKLNVQFSTRHWNALGNGGDTFADTGYQATWEVSRAQAGTSGILVNYTGGEVAMQQGVGTPQQLAQQFLARLEPVLPGITPEWNGTATMNWWPGEPWAKGSYSFYKVGQYTAFGGAEGARSGNCHFAGEHTSVEAQGYLNGAVETGARAAAEILADLKVRA